MRIAYLDEAGIAGPPQEPIVVVAGVIVHAEEQLLAIEARLREIVAAHLPEKDREGFILHCIELFSGGKTLKREEWDRERRWKIIDDLVQVPKQFNLPVIFSYVDLEVLKKRRPHLDKRELIIAGQTISAMNCVCGIERYIREKTPEKELGIVIYENNDTARNAVRDMHNYMRDPKLIVGDVPNPMARILPLTRVVEAATFAEKSESSLLQLADICAFVIKRRMMCKLDSERWIQHIGKQLIADPAGGWPTLSEAPKEGVKA